MGDIAGASHLPVIATAELPTVLGNFQHLSRNPHTVWDIEVCIDVLDTLVERVKNEEEEICKF